jgi:UDP-glucose 4-epimerase
MSPVCLVTGAAGFIGSHLSERLITEGYEVIGVDCFTEYYPRAMKERNIHTLRHDPHFRFIEADLRVADLGSLLNGVDYIFHFAAQAGVRSSWGENFAVYLEHNVLATQRLLEATKGRKITRFIYASSSSIYGNVRSLPIREDALPRPFSPYGVTKLAGELLCQLYCSNFEVPAVALRYFTVYGPRQRPDMAIYRFIWALLRNEPITIYGDGGQTRDFTFVADAVEASLLAMRCDIPGAAFNIGGGARVTVRRVIETLEEITGRKARLEHRQAQPGDVHHTLADTSAAQRSLGFIPKVSLKEGLQAQVTWMMNPSQFAIN